MILSLNSTTLSTVPLYSRTDVTSHTLAVGTHSVLLPSGRLTHHLERVDVFLFTFYWALVFHSLLFLITGGVACFNIIYPSRRHMYGVTSASMSRNCALRAASQSHHPMIPLSPLASGRSPDPLLPEPPEPPDTIDTEVPRPPQPRKNVRRSR